MRQRISERKAAKKTKKYSYLTARFGSEASGSKEKSSQEMDSGWSIAQLISVAIG